MDSPRIVAFTKDWSDVPTCTTHILRIMGKTHPVLWIESIGTRKVSLAIGKDWKRVWRRLRQAFSRAEIKENQLRVLSPLVIPKAQSKVVQWVNRWLIQLQINGELRRMGPGPVEYWCFVPNAVDLLPSLLPLPLRERTEVRGGWWGIAKREKSVSREDAKDAKQDAAGVPNNPTTESPASRVIYYCVDDWSQFHNLDGAWLSRKEEELLLRADVVFAASRFLEVKCRKVAGVRVHYMPHGVDHALFAQALNSDVKEPDDLVGLPHPRIGFYGNLHPWVDLELVESLARSHAEWNFVLIGEIYCDVLRLRTLANVHLLGRREHKQLPFYCKGFDVEIIPYDMKQSRMESVNPVKTKELLAAGVPVVAADIPELRSMGDDVLVCRGRTDWDDAIRRQLDRRDRREIARRVISEDWVAKVKVMREIVKVK